MHPRQAVLPAGCWQVTRLGAEFPSSQHLLCSTGSKTSLSPSSCARMLCEVVTEVKIHFYIFSTCNACYSLISLYKINKQIHFLISFTYFPLWLSGECKKCVSFKGFSMAVTSELCFSYPPWIFRVHRNQNHSLALSQHICIIIIILLYSVFEALPDTEWCLDPQASSAHAKPPFVHTSSRCYLPSAKTIELTCCILMLHQLCKERWG